MTTIEISPSLASALQQADPSNLQSLLRLHQALITANSIPGAAPADFREGLASTLDAIEEALHGRFDAIGSALDELRRTLREPVAWREIESSERLAA